MPVLNWLRTRPTRKPARAARSRPRTQLDAEVLESREVPTVSSITSNFNGTAIPAGDYLWFSSVAKVSGLGTAPATVHVTNQTISFTAAGTPFTLAVPDSTLVFNPVTPSASATFDAGGWEVASPSHFSGNVFLGGMGFQFTSGLPGGIKNVVWSGNFTSDTAGLKINWQWGASVYTQFSTDPSALGVKATDGSTAAYNNSDHAGTPEAFKSFVIGGARGGGGSNFTGSYSATGSVMPELTTPPENNTASVSGFVFQDLRTPDENSASGFDDVVGGELNVTVSLFDVNGNLVAQTTTAGDGSYSFDHLAAGTYSITLTTVPATATDGTSNYALNPTSSSASSGVVNGVNDGTVNGMVIGSIVLGAGASGTNYNFNEVYVFQPVQP
jgi:SdrD B-like domain